MYVVSSIPITKGIPKDNLTYFSTKKVSPGDIATVMVHGRQIHALIVEVADARDMKSAVKHGDFQLKKILKVEPGFIPASIIASARETAEYYATSVSKVLGAMYPKNVLAEAEAKNLETGFPNYQRNRVSKLYCIEGTQEDRFVWIKKNILEKNRKVLYVSPSNHELSKAKNFFACDTSDGHPMSFTSPEYGFVWLPYVDAIILDHASGAGYEDRSSAKIDFKKVYELHAKRNNQELAIADSVLDLAYSTQDSPVCSLTPWPNVTVVRKERKVDHTSWLVSKEAVVLVERTQKTSGQMFFFAPRKSIASITICSDCGEVVQCAHCKRPLTLARKNGKQIFICPECREASDSRRRCAHCDSWKLSPLGITVESVANELEKLFPKAHVLRISSDVIKTKTALAKIAKQFYTTPGSLLVGTELAIPYLDQNISCAVISSLDAYLSGRSLSGTDKAARIAFDVASLTQDRLGGNHTRRSCVLVETGDPKQQFFSDLESGSLKRYRERELAERRKFNYPPYGVIIRVGAETHFINKEQWPNRELIEKIKSLPKSVSYEIDADRAM